MTLILSGTNGLSDVDGDASTPAVRGTDANSGIFFGADTVGISAGGTQKLSIGTGSATVDGLTVGQGAGSVSSNTAVGASALAANTTGANNVAVGYQALDANTTGQANTAVGSNALGANTTGQENTAIGISALASNTTGNENTAVGRQALTSATTASANTAMGEQALGSTTTGGNNTAFGRRALQANTTGANNTAVGYEAGVSITTGSGNVCIGYLAGKNQFSSSSNNLFIARSNTGAGNAATWILGDGNGACIQGNNSSSWTTVSDGRLKNVLCDFDKGLNAINQLSVKKFKYKSKEEMPDLIKNEFGIATFEPDATIEYVGVIAQELQSVIPEAVKQNDNGILQVDSDAVFWSAIKAIKELSAQVIALQAEVNTLKGQ